MSESNEKQRKNELLAFVRSKLKPTSTKITYLNGRKCITNLSTNENENEIEPETLSSFGYVLQIEPDLTCDEIIPHLYLSGDDVAQNYEILKSKSVTHVLNLTTNIKNLFENENIIYKRFVIYDLPTQNLIPYFDEAFEFIDSALLFHSDGANNNVLVHCNMGVSRSASFVIAYLLKKGIFTTYLSAYSHLKTCRPKVFPNDGFVNQLKQYEKSLRASTEK